MYVLQFNHSSHYCLFSLTFLSSRLPLQPALSGIAVSEAPDQGITYVSHWKENVVVVVSLNKSSCNGA